MSKKLVLAEKPSVGRDIAHVLNCKEKHNGYFEGKNYVVTWALGHLVTLADPETYDPKYQKWNLEDLPMLPAPLKLEVIRNTRKQYNAVKTLIHRNDISEIIIATDAGREGELVARWILEKAHCKKNSQRLWISSVTDKAIKEGFNTLRPGKNYDRLYASALARSEADWYVGLNATRALTTKYNAQLSCGRVQTPTLAMVAERERDIQTFKSKTFFGLQALTQNLHFVWVDPKSKSARTFDQATIDAVEEKCSDHKIKIDKIQKTLKKVPAPQLYDLTELQREANRKYGFSAKQTLNAMQKLYETHKILTYPRTDSRYISLDIVPTLKDRIKACGSGEFGRVAGKLLKQEFRLGKNYVDDSKVTDHHAIIPTEHSVPLHILSTDERKIYDLVVQRFLAVLMPVYQFEQTSIEASIHSEHFIAKGKRIVDLGWKAVYSDYDDAISEEDIHDQTLPNIYEGQTFESVHLRRTEGKTQPPKYHTEGTLLSAMERPSKNMPYGIGTVATRADIIEKLHSSFLIEKKDQYLYMTSKGKQLLEIVPEDLKKPELTAEWEEKLEKIAKGQLEKDTFISEIKQYTQSTVANIKNSSVKFKHDNLTREKCPDCGKNLLLVNGKKGKLYVCQDRECGYRRSLSIVTNARCPVCHKKMELRGEGENKSFFCRCGHREKLDAFNKRRKEAGNKGSAKDVKAYLDAQKKENSFDSPLAEALKKLKL
ncbi:DNA topoisomerase III [Fusibacter tunisiensis]|uniref:DNA topoisomerase 3 n=1 Tax=Fusibacter tunisiensis TaxID=1008308 RepID=A0ABS2MMQ2_9FIRM|nr:DNA topoisomerase III [Fusibacter tunisiensis]MBM7560680.1 DNA topoisomerase-3 [Fusibacter tunisiensis]